MLEQSVVFICERDAYQCRESGGGPERHPGGGPASGKDLE